MKKKDDKNYCRRCRSEIPEGMAFCPHCMEKIEENGGTILLKSRYKPRVNKWFAVIVTAVLCIILVMLFTVFSMLASPDKKDEQPTSESSTAEQITTVQTTTVNTTEITSLSSATVTATATEEITNTTATAKVTVPETKEVLTDTAVAEETDIIPDAEEVFADDTAIPETPFTEPPTEETTTIQLPQTDFESMIRNGFDSWVGFTGDSETLSFDGYSCTFSDKLMGENVNCKIDSADDFSSYVLTISGDEYSTGNYVYGVDGPIRAYTDIILGYKPLYMGDNIRSAIRDMLSNRETSCHVAEEDFTCDIEYNYDTYIVTVSAGLN